MEMCYLRISNAPCVASQPRCHLLAQVPMFKTVRSDLVPCSLRATVASLSIQPVQTDPRSVDTWSWCPACHDSLKDTSWPSHAHGQALLPYTVLSICASRQLPPLCIYSALAESPVALAGWGPGPCLWARQLVAGLTSPQGQSGRDAALGPVQLLGRHFLSVSALTGTA